jgi:acyl dehydratase
MTSQAQPILPRQGESRTYTRTFTLSDVQAFAQVSLDHGAHHLSSDDSGRLLVHGLLTATIPTKLGGDLNYLAQDMAFHFHRPVFSGDTIECLCTATKVENRDLGTFIEFAIRCQNQHGKEVLTGTTQGLALHHPPLPAE